MGAIRIQTAIPGPRSRELQTLREKLVPRAPYHATPVYIARGEGAVVEDAVK